MKRKKPKYRMLIFILPFLVVLSIAGIGYGSWIIGNNATGVRVNFNSEVGELKETSLLKHIKTTTNMHTSNKKLYADGYSGMAIDVNHPGFIISEFELTNRDETKNLIKTEIYLTIKGISNDIQKYIPENCFLFHGCSSGWTQKSQAGVIFKEHINKTKSQTILFDTTQIPNFRFNNPTPNDPKTRFKLEFRFIDFSGILSSNERLLFNLKIVLKDV